MPGTPTFSCLLVGADTLLVACGDLLLQRGHEIVAVATRAPRIERWARSKGIATLAPDDVAGMRTPFDHLFAITHLSILPDEVLALPRRSAINFHDGPLPRYAGLNAPAWALMNGETEYGIAWHLITPGVDEGDLLATRAVEIGPGETSLSLNTKCFEAAIESFGGLVDDLAAQRTRPVPQDATQRTYFGRHDRPSAACAIDWTASAARIEALVRALDFGRYENPLGSPKLAHEGEVFVVTSARASAGTGSSAPAPGTVLACDAGGLRVATGDGELLVEGLTACCGRVVDTAALGWAPGTVLGPDVALRSQLDALDETLSRSERAWMRRLADLVPLEIPYATTPGREQGATGGTGTVAVGVPAAFRTRWSGDGDLAAAIGVWLGLLTGSRAFDLGLRDRALDERIGGLRAWVAREVPLRVALDTAAGFEAARTSLANELARVRSRLTWHRDAPRRHPSLAAGGNLADGPALPVCLSLGTDARTGTATGLVLALDEHGVRIVHDERIADADARAMAAQLGHVLGTLAAQPERPLRELDLLAPEERRRMLVEWNDTALDHDRETTIHTQFEEQVDRTPDRTALVFEGAGLTYRELDERANRLAAHLTGLGAGPERLVGICVERSHDLLVAVLATLKTGAAYVPLDPAFPAERVAFMLSDARAPIVVTQTALAARFATGDATIVRLDGDREAIAARPAGRPNGPRAADGLCYVMYTSGSTGLPKGVMVEHRNVVNFFAGMDERIARDPSAARETWLAVTSLSFDISVLELLWTLTRGFEVVVFLDRERERKAGTARRTTRKVDFSLFYFNADESAGSGRERYRLLLEGARFGDEHGFSAVWTPERHFHAFGGLYPNPAVTGAAVAAITKNVRIRAGSVVLPLHHPVRVAETWSVVDNLSDGRVDVSFAAGWQPDDFVLAPQNYGDAKRVMFESIETVKRLWRGEKVSFEGPRGPVEVGTLPRPVQAELPIWVTTAGNTETYVMAGRAGANVLTHLLGQSIADLAPKIAAYREARRAAGFDPETGVVSLMLHTFVHDDEDEAREIVREPLKRYLGTSLSLIKHYAWAFPAFAKPAHGDVGAGDELAGLTPEEQDALLEHAFERYYETSGLFGRPDTCLELVDRLAEIGVDDIACLVDFGVDTERALHGLEALNRLRELAQVHAGAGTATADHSIAAQIRRHGVTHLQCTPSMARMLTGHDETRAALATVKHVMVGGEALPLDLARELAQLVAGSVTNMYGPTETTIWSATWTVPRDAASVAIGRPIANTSLYVLDAELRPVPAGVHGELWIGGEGVVRGYHERPELTAQRFVPDPFAAAARPATRGTPRMYRTGDVARFRPDGTLEFLGRTDHQVKIRGYRIELGEIEALLGDRSDVNEAVVVAREDVPGDQRLVAYVVPAATDLDPATLRAALRERLPDYMVPAAFVMLEALPVTPNGKIDRKALPAPETVADTRAAEYVAPSDDLQTTVAELWQEILGRDRIGIDDNFFDIGGHSLLVVRLHRRLADCLERPISLTDLYRFPTIRSLTDFLNAGVADDDLEESDRRAQRRRESLQRRRTQRRA